MRAQQRSPIDRRGRAGTTGEEGICGRRVRKELGASVCVDVFVGTQSLSLQR